MEPNNIIYIFLNTSMREPLVVYDQRTNSSTIQKIHSIASRCFFFLFFINTVIIYFFLSSRPIIATIRSSSNLRAAKANSPRLFIFTVYLFEYRYKHTIESCCGAFDKKRKINKTSELNVPITISVSLSLSTLRYIVCLSMGTR